MIAECKKFVTINFETVVKFGGKSTNCHIQNFWIVVFPTILICTLGSRVQEVCDHNFEIVVGSKVL